jgi:hypothetical protein
MDQRTLELIHASLDGELNTADSLDLQRLLAESAEARREHERAQAIDKALASLAVHEPPPGLRDAILARALPRPATAPARQASSAAPLRRTGLGIAAAIAASAALVVVLLTNDAQLPELDPSALAGTIGRHAGAVPHAISMDEGAVSGAVRLHRGEHGLVIEVDLDSSKPITLVARAGGDPLEFEGIVPLAGSPVGATRIEDGIRVVHDGNQHYAIVLRQHDFGGSTINLAVFDGDRLIGETGLKVSADGALRKK